MKPEQIQALDDEAQSELRTICSSIVARQWNEDTWSSHESDDEFQTEHLCGGFDATEREFCFSYYSSDGKEYWFQFPLIEAKRLVLSAGAPPRLREAE
jgi:hypothetical protein